MENPRGRAPTKAETEGTYAPRPEAEAVTVDKKQAAATAAPARRRTPRSG